MRLDRTMSLYAFRPLLEMNVVSRTGALPILMYHSISKDPEPGISQYYKTSTSPSLFAQHMRWLKEQGFRSASLEEGIQLVQSGGVEQEKVVVITFDDGFRDFQDAAFPALKAHGYTATVFLPTAYIDGNRRSFKNKECLTWQEVRALQMQGIQFGSHTVRHPVLYNSSWSEIEEELSSSKEKLEQELGVQVACFAYPYAFPQQDRHFTATFKKLLQAVGYRIGVTTMIGRVKAGEDLLSLKRLPANNCDDKPLFHAKLLGAYDGIGLFQSWSKSIRRRMQKVLRSVSGAHDIKKPVEPLQSSSESLT